MLNVKGVNVEDNYHDDMNSWDYIKLVNEKLTPNLPRKSVLILDNASYHNVSSERAPTSNT